MCVSYRRSRAIGQPCWLWLWLATVSSPPASTPAWPNSSVSLHTSAAANTRGSCLPYGHSTRMMCVLWSSLATHWSQEVSWPIGPIHRLHPQPPWHSDLALSTASCCFRRGLHTSDHQFAAVLEESQPQNSTTPSGTDFPASFSFIHSAF